MERRFDMSDFEQSLKDHADQFKMVPSKRVWKGLYNNLHPGSKWPSVTVAMVFIITLLTVGNLNNSPNQEKSSQISKAESAKNVSENSVVENGFASSNDSIETHEPKDQKHYSGRLSNEKNFSTNSIDSEQFHVLTHKNKSSFNSKYTLIPEIVTSNPSKPHSHNSYLLKQKYEIAKDYDLSETKMELSELGISKSLQKDIGSNRILANSLHYNELSQPGNSNSLKHLFSFARIVTNELSLVDMNSLYDDAGVLKELDLNSLKNNSKKIKNIKWIYYVTPSRSSAIFRNEEVSQGMSPNFSLLQIRSSNGMTYKSGFGLKVGTEINRRISKKWDIITGLDLGYSSYDIVSNLVHPTFTTLLFKDDKGFDYSKRYITHFGNGMTQNKMDILNYSLQASIPLGLQYHIWEDEKVQINVLSSIDLSTVLKSNAYIISSDGRYYVKDPSLTRPVNMGLNFNPNIVIYGGKVKWHLGPSIRYQFLSRYKNNYVSKEHLIDYGIKVGISK
ncbi:MAG: hypothetical protein ABI325_13505 [Ginsengibacter sp.]